MTGSSNDVDPQSIWQSQPPDPMTISLAEIRARAARLERRVARRNLSEYIAAVAVVAGFGWMLWLESSRLIRVSAVLVIAATVFVVYRLHVRGSAATLHTDLMLKSAVEFHRLQLERQRDLLRSVWWWYFLPLLPGLLLVQVGQAVAHPDRLSRSIVTSVLTVALAVGGYELNRRAAARFQERIDRLNENR